MGDPLSINIAPHSNTDLNDAAEYEKFIQAVLQLSDAKSDITNDETNHTAALEIIKKAKLKFYEVDENTQNLFVDFIDKRLDSEALNILENPVFQLNESSINNLNNIINYLEVFNNVTYEHNSFGLKFVQKSESIKKLFEILKKILEEKTAYEKKELIKGQINKLLALIINVLEITSRFVRNEWKEFDVEKVIINIANEFENLTIRNKCLNIIRNTFDYENIDAEETIDFEINQYDTPDERKIKRMSAIDRLLSLTDEASCVRSKTFFKALRYIGVNSEHEKFDDIHDDETKERFINFLVKFIDFNYAYLAGFLKQFGNENQTIESDKKAEILKRLAFINYIHLFIITRYSLKSSDFYVNGISKTTYFDIVIQILQNESLHEIVFKFKPDIVFYAYTKCLSLILTVLEATKPFMNINKACWNAYSPKVVFNIGKLISKFGLNSQNLLNMIPFLLNYSDNDDEGIYTLREAIFKNPNDFDLFQESMSTLVDLDDPEKIINSRKMLNLLASFIPNTEKFCRLSAEVTKKFIKLSVNVIKFGHALLREDLKKFDATNTEYQQVIDRLLKVSFFIRQFSITIQNTADKILEFCIQFHEESEDGIQVIMNLVNDDILQQTFSKYQNNFVISLLTSLFYRSGFGALHNLSKAAYKFKETWTRLDTFNVLLKLGNKLHSVDSYFQLTSFMTIANIASNDDLNNFSAALSILETITNKIKDFTFALDKSKFKIIRNLFQIGENESKVEVITLRGWNLYEIMEALYRFSVNDSIKSVIYDTLKVKEYLRIIIYNGNESEQEYAFKLLNQLCFDKKIADDVVRDEKLLDFMKQKIANKKTITRKNLIKYIEGIMWAINEDNKKKTSGSTNLKHVFISYNSESRPICLSIKNALESMGHKVWIDIEDIHGSSIDAMAKAIESAWCILICMSEKYKESSYCRFEAEYVIQLKKPFVPLIMQKSYKPDGWLGFILGAKIYIDFTKYELQECLSRLKKELIMLNRQNFTNEKSEVEANNVTATLVNLESEIKILNSQPSLDTQNTIANDDVKLDSRKSVFLWSESDVEKWFNNRKISISIKENISPCDGRVLEQLYKMCQDVPEFFYTTLRADTRANLKDIAYFTAELRSLFSTK